MPRMRRWHLTWNASGLLLSSLWIVRDSQPHWSTSVVFIRIFAKGKLLLSHTRSMWRMWCQCAGVHATSDPRYDNISETSTTYNRDHHRRRRQTRFNILQFSFAHIRLVHSIELLFERALYRWPVGRLFGEWRDVIGVDQIREQRVADQYSEVTVARRKNPVVSTAG